MNKEQQEKLDGLLERLANVNYHLLGYEKIFHFIVMDLPLPENVHADDFTRINYLREMALLHSKSLDAIHDEFQEFGLEIRKEA